MDSRFDDFPIVRPLREISDREVAAVSQLENTSRLCFGLGSPKAQIGRGGSVQGATSDFLTSLKVEGYPSTMLTIMAVTSKLELPPPSLTSTLDRRSAKCTLCSSEQEAEDMKLCGLCVGLLREVDEGVRQTVLADVLGLDTVDMT